MSVRRRQVAIPNALEAKPPAPTASTFDVNAVQDLSQDEHKVVQLNIEPGKLKPLQHLNEAAYKQHVREGNLTLELMEQIEAHKRVAAASGM